MFRMSSRYLLPTGVVGSCRLVPTRIKVQCDDDGDDYDDDGGDDDNDDDDVVDDDDYDDAALTIAFQFIPYTVSYHFMLSFLIKS